MQRPTDHVNASSKAARMVIYPGFLLSCAMRFPTATVAAGVLAVIGTAQSASPVRVHWRHLSSSNGNLPVPGTSVQQTGSIVGDFDRDGVSDFVLSFRQVAPAVRPSTSTVTAISISSSGATGRAVTSGGGRTRAPPARRAGRGTGSSQPARRSTTIRCSAISSAPAVRSLRSGTRMRRRSFSRRFPRRRPPNPGRRRRSSRARPGNRAGCIRRAPTPSMWTGMAESICSPETRGSSMKAA